ncbi:MAG: SDR family NAD(P)-dependent oxidoreductase [Gammaproteobacteria bacterium]|jgi:3-hydroxy acid dehydrogenase/malonic semialdehyde reductase
MQTTNQIAFVTGASSGIGESLARQLVNNGYRVIGTARKLERLDGLTRELGERFFALELDLNDQSSVDRVASDLPSSWKQVDVLVNNAGHDVGGRRPFQDGDCVQWLDIIETNVNGLIRITYALLPDMLKRNRGHIVNIGSTSGIEPVPTTAVYSASKHAVNGLSESLRKELESTGVRVSQVLPGMVRTGFAEARFGDQDTADKFYDDFGKWLNPDDVANAILYIISQPQHVVVSQLVVVPKPI